MFITKIIDKTGMKFGPEFAINLHKLATFFFQFEIWHF